MRSHYDALARCTSNLNSSGLTIPETAEALDISPATVKRDWSMAQAWLYREVQSADSGNGAAAPPSS